MPSKRKHNKAGRYRDVILDSNIIQYLGTPSLDEKIMECLREAITANYDLVISDISFYELLNAASVEVESKIINRLAGAKRFYVARKPLVYKKNGSDAFMYTAFIEPDLDVINQYYNIRLGKLETDKG